MAEEFRYRPDIDGLRAVAVLAVVGFHAEIGALRGGFAGVDVFFVISGYLISGIIFRALERKRFSYAEFYTRRINRIFPALILVLLASAIAGWTVLFPNEFATLGKHIVGGSAFISNFFLWNEAGYFDSASKPLLHLWSLSVEEQFYLAWPLVLVLAWSRKELIRWLLVVIILLSFSLNVWAVTHSNGNAAFFSPLTRFWEILAGALLCRSELAQSTWLEKFQRSRAMTNCAALAGLVLLIAAFRLLDSDVAWPGWLAILPVGGTVLLLLAGEMAWVNKFILSSRPLVFVGLISYPLYLWHWPLLVFPKLVYTAQLPRAGRLIAIIVSLLLAAATYQFVEKPIRFGRHKRRSALRLAAVMSCLAIAAALLWTRILPARLNGAYSTLVEQAATDDPIGGSYFSKTGDELLAPFIPGDSTNVTALWGDSHALQYAPRFQKLAKDGGPGFPQTLLLAYGGCPPLPHVNRIGISWDGAPWRCEAVFQKSVAILRRPEVKSIVISAYWEADFGSHSKVYSTVDPKRRFMSGGSDVRGPVLNEFEHVVADLEREGKRVYIVLSSPSDEAYDPMTMLPPRLPGFPNRKMALSVPRGTIEARLSGVGQFLRKIAASSGATVIDPVEYLCGERECPTADANGNPFYRDSDHMRASYVRDHASYLDVTTKR